MSGRFIGAFFLDFLPFTMSLYCIPILLIRQLSLLIYIALFIVMICLNIKIRKETAFH